MKSTNIICRIDGIPVIACSEVKDGARHAPAGARLMKFFCEHCGKDHFHEPNPTGKLTLRRAACIASPYSAKGYYLFTAKRPKLSKTLDLFRDIPKETFEIVNSLKSGA